MSYLVEDGAIEVPGCQHLNMHKIPISLPVYMRILLSVIGQEKGAGIAKILRNAVLRELMLYADQYSQTDLPMFSEELKNEASFDFESNEVLILALIKAFVYNHGESYQPYSPHELNLPQLLAIAERSNHD